MSLLDPEDPNRTVCIVDDDADSMRRLARACARGGFSAPVIAPSFARCEPRSARVVALVARVRIATLCDAVAFQGAWLDRHDGASTLWLVPEPSREILNAAFELGICVLCPPWAEHSVDAFLKRAVRKDDSALEFHAHLRALGRIWGFTPRQLEILRCAMEGVPREDVALRLGISGPTMKSHVRAILQKVGVRSLSSAACVVLSQMTQPPRAQPAAGRADS